MTTGAVSTSHTRRHPGESSAERIMAAAARILLGFIFLASGLNGFFHFFSLPPIEGRGATFIDGLLASGYVFPLLFTTYIIAGAALLIGRFVPLALVLLAPAIVNIFAVHAVLAPKGLPLAILVVVLEMYLTFRHHDAYRPLVRA